MRIPFKHCATTTAAYKIVLLYQILMIIFSFLIRIYLSNDKLIYSVVPSLDSYSLILEVIRNAWQPTKINQNNIFIRNADVASLKCVEAVRIY